MKLRSGLWSIRKLVVPFRLALMSCATDSNIETDRQKMFCFSRYFKREQFDRKSLKFLNSSPYPLTVVGRFLLSGCRDDIVVEIFIQLEIFLLLSFKLRLKLRLELWLDICQLSQSLHLDCHLSAVCCVTDYYLVISLIIFQFVFGLESLKK